MIRFFLGIYDFLRGRRWLAGLVAVAVMAVCGLLATRLHYEEDITRFLPSDGQSAEYSEAYNALGQKNNIIILFKPAADEADGYSIADAIDAFGEAFDRIDTAGIVTERQITVDQGQVLDMMDAVTSEYPLYLTEEDYRRIDSLLQVPGYVAEQLAEDRHSLLFPSGDLVARYIQSDPLHLFSPVLQRLRSSAANGNYEITDGCIFTKEGYGLAFLTSPYGMSESGMNAQVARMVEEAAGQVEASNPGVKVSAVGAPLIAVTNASRIKKDSILAITLALILIGLLLAFTYRRFSDIAWIGLSIAFGWVFALGAMSLIRDSMSIIVIGVASVIIGIAVNYPLHYVDGFKAGISPRMNLKEMVTPLLIGNITTIAAFLCLAWLDAVAMQDLGLFGSLMLAGTIIFVLVFLPVFARSRGQVSRTFEPGRILPDKVPASKWLFLAVMALTVVFYFASRKTAFDSDMGNINYMTPVQRADLKLLEGGLEQEGFRQMYAIAEGETLEEALESNDRLREKLEGNGLVAFVKGPGNFVPSEAAVAERVERWNGYWAGGRGERLAAELISEAAKAGFSDDAFAPFLALLDTLDIEGHEGFALRGHCHPRHVKRGDHERSEWWGRAERDVRAGEAFMPYADDAVLAAFEGTYVIRGEGKCRVVNQVYYKDPGDRDALKASLETDGVLVFDTGDISNQLVKVLSESFDYIGLICSLVVFIFLCLSFRRLELSLLSFLPLAVSWFWILGIMGLLDIRFNIVNIILATFIFGQGDDYTIFITEGLIYEYAYGKKRLATYKNSVFNSAVIMFIGIGALALARHPAMKSLGVVTIIGMFIVVMMAYYLPPVIFRWLTEKNGVKRDVPVTLKRLVYSVFSITAFVLLMFLFVYPYTFFHFLGKDSEEKRLSYHRFICRMSRFLIRHVPGVGFRWSGLAARTPRSARPHHSLRSWSPLLQCRGWHGPHQPTPTSEVEAEDEKRPAVIIANHQSHLDLACLMSLTPKLVFFTNEWVWKNPIYGYVIRKAEYYPIADGLEKNLDRIKGLVARGYSLVVFPEGTRTKDGRIGRFHKGAFYVASELGLDIVPVFLHGADHVLPKTDFMLREGTVTMEVGPRMEAGNDYRQATKRFHRLFLEHFQEMKRELETPEYLSKYVRYKYMYKGADVEARCRRALAALAKPVGELAEPPALRQAQGPERNEQAQGPVIINNCGQGEYALIYALMHPETEVHAYDPDEENIMLASNCSNLPPNLHYHVGGEDKTGAAIEIAEPLEITAG